MCRWLCLLSGREISLDSFVLNSSNSLIHQSFDAAWHPGFSAQNNATLNADGFGVGWYHTREASSRPALFKGIFPAWNNQNLHEICQATASDCVMGHVRAASLGSVVSRENCHPFKAGRLLFCHNGHVEQFGAIKRPLLALLSETAFAKLCGTTDSESVFMLLLTQLADPLRDSPFGPGELEAALSATIGIISRLLAEAGVTSGFTTLNCALTDGDTMVVSRWCDKNPAISPPSLYYTWGPAEVLHSELTASAGQGCTPGDGTGKGEARPEKKQKLPTPADAPGASFEPAEGCFVAASEPLTKNDSAHTWHAIEANTMLSCTRGQKPVVQPIVVSKP